MLNQKIIELVKALPDEQITGEFLETEIKRLKVKDMKQLEDITADYCYNRSLCACIGVDYKKLTPKEYNRVCLTAIYSMADALFPCFFLQTYK